MYTIITHITLILCFLAAWHQKIGAMEEGYDPYDKRSWTQKMEDHFKPLESITSTTENIPTQEEDFFDINVYSHGLEESCDPKDGPIYLGANGNITEAAFYGWQNIQRLAQYLDAKIKENPNKKIRFIIKGKSMGASIIVTALEKLILSAENDTSIIENINKTDATQILEAVNRGKILLSVPALSMQHTCAVAFAAKLASSGSLLLFCGFSLYGKFLFDSYKNKTCDKQIYLTEFFLTATLTIVFCHNKLTNIYANAINHYIIPWQTRHHYNPFSTTPLDAAKNVRRYVTCPMLIHCSKNDGLLLNPNKDTADFFKSLKEWDERYFHTWLLLSNDDTHDTNNNLYNNISEDFKASLIQTFNNTMVDKYNFPSDVWINNTNAPELEKISAYNPSIFELGRSVWQSLDCFV